MRGRNLSRIPGHVISDRREHGTREHQPFVDILRGVFQHSPDVSVWVDERGTVAVTVDDEMRKVGAVLVRNGSADDLGDGAFRLNWILDDYPPPANEVARGRFARLTRQVRQTVSARKRGR